MSHPSPPLPPLQQAGVDWTAREAEGGSEGQNSVFLCSCSKHRERAPPGTAACTVRAWIGLGSTIHRGCAVTVSICTHSPRDGQEYQHYRAGVWVSGSCMSILVCCRGPLEGGVS